MFLKHAYVLKWIYRRNNLQKMHFLKQKLFYKFWLYKEKEENKAIETYINR